MVHDLLGGELVRGEVHVDGRRVDFHWWNRLAGGVDVDLTREQFTAGEAIVAETVVARQPRLKRLVEEYELLRGRVAQALEG